MAITPKRPRDKNQLTKFITYLATGAKQEPDKIKVKNPAAEELVRLGGKRQGPLKYPINEEKILPVKLLQVGGVKINPYNLNRFMPAKGKQSKKQAPAKTRVCYLSS